MALTNRERRQELIERGRQGMPMQIEAPFPQFIEELDEDMHDEL